MPKIEPRKLLDAFNTQEVSSSKLSSITSDSSIMSDSDVFHELEDVASVESNFLELEDDATSVVDYDVFLELEDDATSVGSYSLETVLVPSNSSDFFQLLPPPIH